MEQLASPLQLAERLQPMTVLAEPVAGLAAVLILLEWQARRVVLIERASHLPQHAGEYAFPGGYWKAGEASLWHTALRESVEEIGVEPDRVVPLGVLSSRSTRHGTPVTAIVAELRQPGPWRIDAGEVAAVWQLPWAWLAQPQVCWPAGYHRQGEEAVHFHCGQRCIWGVTAAFLRELLSLLGFQIVMGGDHHALSAA